MIQCKCKRGYASQIDGKCCKCRSHSEREKFERMRSAYHKGYNLAEQFPNLEPIANPYRHGIQRDLWEQGRKDAHAQIQS